MTVTYYVEKIYLNGLLLLAENTILSVLICIGIRTSPFGLFITNIFEEIWHELFSEQKSISMKNKTKTLHGYSNDNIERP